MKLFLLNWHFNIRRKSVKFRGGDSQIIKNEYGFRRRVICFLLSSVFHAIFLYLIFNYKITVKIYSFKREVREVILVSPDKVYIPEDMDKFIKSPPEIGLIKNNRFSGRERKLKNELKVDEMPGAGIDIDQGLIDGEHIKYKGDNITSDLNLVSGFRLNLPSTSKMTLPLDYKLDLSLKFEETKNMFRKKEKDRIRKDINLLKYLYSDFSNIYSSKTYPAGGSFGAGTSRRRGSVSLQGSGYDITPWAEKVVNKIQENWIIPSSQKMRAKGLVGISVIIEKSGELFSVKIVNSSKVQLLDEAALKALKLSSPFPHLPEDFPQEGLEAYFEFHYND